MYTYYFHWYHYFYRCLYHHYFCYLSKLLLLTAFDKSSTSHPLLLLFLLVTVIVFGVLYFFFAKAIKRTMCFQQEYRGTNFAYFVQTTIMCLICNENLYKWQLQRPRTRAFLGIFLFFLLLPFYMFAKNSAAGLGGVNTLNITLLRHFTIFGQENAQNMRR